MPRKRRHASDAQLELLSGGVPIAVQYRRMKERSDRVSVGRSKIEGWGGFLNEAVGANEMLIEYVGELIRLKLADLRELEYDRKGMGCYMFRVNDEWVVDATMTGGPARFLNHSCDPNCVTRIEQVEGAVPRILIYSKRPIEAGAELTYDYKFPIEDKKIPCFCGAAMCRGSMN
jgi:histone-lysine N-methyltransferase MLL1